MENSIRSYTRQEVLELTSRRAGESKIGEFVSVAGEKPLGDALASSNAEFVLLGIPEDIGPRANLGKPGTAMMWQSFLPAFLSIQQNQFLDGKHIFIAGEIVTHDLQQKATAINFNTENGLQESHKLVDALDKRVTEIIAIIRKTSKIPIVIGGGHNNCYGLIAGCHAAWGKRINVINIDPHADLRETSHRHSGNGFSAAERESLLETYVNIGLHESYNNQFILNGFDRESRYFFPYDAMLRGEVTLEQALQTAIGICAGAPTGLEFDMDAIENFPSSASTPSGFSAEQARKIIITLAGRINVQYLHLPEGIPGTNVNGINAAKLMSYLVSDFIKTVLKK